ncbi:PTS sugar transporter subunit IIA [Spirillospora sp. NPDC048911]|uniref:PTS sugar transporter subunit IIA n=1 Tax=Spirillospora sp. NPDC048911 TaxID=3364527 RepID=UPI003712FBA2
MAEPTIEPTIEPAAEPAAAPAALLDPRAVRLDAVAADRDDAIRQCGRLLAEVGAVTDAYIESMLDRERSISTHLGEGVAIPHGTAAGKDSVRRDALAVVKFPGGVDWGGHPVTLAIAIAARGDGHMAILAELAQILLDPEKARGLREAGTADEVVRLLQPTEEESAL